MRASLYIDGAWVPSSGSDTIDVENPATEEVIGRVPSGTADDVDKAVQAAKAAFPAWAPPDAEDRPRYLPRLAESVTAKHEEIARTIAQDIGAPIKIAQMVQPGLP